VKTLKSPIIKELILAWILVIGLSRLSDLFTFIPLVENNLSLITAILLLYVPIFIGIRKREKIVFIDRSLKDFFESIKLFCVFSAIIFPLFLLGNHLYQSVVFNTSYHAQTFPDWINFILYEIIVIATPEEFFFRGYFQGKMNLLFEKKWKLLGATIGPGLVLTSLIFALSHSVISWQWWHIFIFFPSMAFGWLKEKSGTITAGILFHATCNLVAQWIALHY
jgi:uncharacterized protein